MQGKAVRRIALVLCIVILLASCSRESVDNSGFSVVAAGFPSYDAARAVMKGVGKPYMLLPPGVETHSYDPNPKDMTAVAEADLVIYTGGHSDHWIDEIIAADDDPPKAFRLIDQVELLSEEHREGMEEGHHSHTIDEHVWTSIPNEMRIVSAFADVLSSMDPENARTYMENSDGYIAELSVIDDEIREIVRNSRLDTLIFASRFPLLYFVREYGLEYYAAFPGCAEETEPSARTVAFLIDKAREIGCHHILNIEFSSASIARTIAEEAGCSVLVFYSMHNISASDFAAGETYVSLMRKNAETLREALS